MSLRNRAPGVRNQRRGDARDGGGGQARPPEAAGGRRLQMGDYAEATKVVPGGGFEPPTRGFSVRCSTN